MWRSHQAGVQRCPRAPRGIAFTQAQEHDHVWGQEPVCDSEHIVCVQAGVCRCILQVGEGRASPGGWLL